MLQSLGFQALIGIFSHLIFIVITWQVLQAVNIDPIVRKGKIFEARVLMIFLTIVIGTTVSNFFLDILQWSGQLNLLF